MKINYKKTSLRFVLSQVVLLCLFMAFGSSKAFAQCNYVTTENGKETKISIPCDFPVKYNTNNPELDKQNFKEETQKWFSKDASMLELKATLAKSPNLQLEIPIVEYNKFTSQKKSVIDGHSNFYKVVQSNK
jgi:hypothetical protein